MAEKAEKNKSGAGKFVLGALLGAAVGAVASKFIKIKTDGGEELDNLAEDLAENLEEKVEKAAEEKVSKKKAASQKTSDKKSSERE